jgi:hypothetical protein
LVFFFFFFFLRFPVCILNCKLIVDPHVRRAQNFLSLGKLHRRLKDANRSDGTVHSEMPVKERCFLQGIARVCARTRYSRGVTYPTENRVSIQKPKTISLRGGSVSSPVRDVCQCCIVKNCISFWRFERFDSRGAPELVTRKKKLPLSHSHFRKESAMRLLNCSRLHDQQSAGLFAVMLEEKLVPKWDKQASDFRKITKIRRKNTLLDSRGSSCSNRHGFSCDFS